MSGLCTAPRYLNLPCTFRLARFQGIPRWKGAPRADCVPIAGRSLTTGILEHTKNNLTDRSRHTGAPGGRPRDRAARRRPGSGRRPAARAGPRRAASRRSASAASSPSHALAPQFRTADAARARQFRTSLPGHARTLHRLLSTTAARPRPPRDVVVAGATHASSAAPPRGRTLCRAEFYVQLMVASPRGRPKAQTSAAYTYDVGGRRRLVGDASCAARLGVGCAVRARLRRRRVQTPRPRTQAFSRKCFDFGREMRRGRGAAAPLARPKQAGSFRGPTQRRDGGFRRRKLRRPKVPARRPVPPLSRRA